jgi:iron complex outermembrane receptor protein
MRRLRTPLRCLLSLLPILLLAAEPGKKPFDLPADTAEKSLKRLAEQSGREVLFPDDAVQGVKTKTVKGEMSPQEALEAMLAGTVLVGVEDAKTGSLTVRRAGSVEEAEKNGARAAPANDRPNANRKTAGNDEVLVLSPFRVGAEKEAGYSAQKTLAGSRVAKPLIDLPTNITIINRELLDDLAAQKLNDVTAYGASGINRNQVISDDITIRGFRNNAGPLRDGAVKFGIIQNQLYDVDRIEVIKGPAAMVLGVDTFLGGTVNYVTRKPTPERIGFIQTSVGNEDYIKAVVNQSGPIYKSNDFTLLYRGTLGLTRSDGYRGIDGLNDKFIGGALAMFFGSRTTVDISAYRYLDYSYQYFNDFLDQTKTPATNTLAYLNPLSTSRLIIAREKDLRTRSFETLLNATVTTRLTDNSDLRFFGSFNSHKNYALYLNWAGTPVDNHIFTGRRVVYQYFDVRNFDAQIDYLHRLEWRWLKNELTLGGDYYYNQQVSGSSILVVPGMFDARNTPFDFSGDDATVSVRYGNVSGGYGRTRAMEATYYVQDTVRLWQEKLLLTGGRRWLNPTEYDDNFLTNTTTRADKKATDSIKYGLVFKPLPSLAFYATKARNTIPLSGFDISPSTGALIPLKDQQGKLTEFGLKADHKFNDHASIYGTIAKFNMELTNARTFRMVDGHLEPFQTEKNTSSGYELDLGFRAVLATGVTDVIATYSRLHTFDPASGLRALGSPDWSGSLLVKYTLTAGPLKGLKVGAGARDQGIELQRTFYIDQPRTYTFFAGYQFARHWEVQANVDNVTDERFVVIATQFQTAQASEPRQLRLTATFKY